MGFKDLHLKLKAFRLSRFLMGDSGINKREYDSMKKPSWMVPISHGYHVVEERSSGGGLEEEEEFNSDSVVVQREQMEGVELWFYGLFDDRIGDRVTKYMQTHLFGRKLKQSQIRRKSKETMRKAYISARAKIRETEEAEETSKVGSASVMVINGEKLVIASMGDFRAVFCRDGVAYQISRRHQQKAKRNWPLKLISGAIRLPKVRILACDSSNAAGTAKSCKSSELLVGVERIDSDTEFIILGSTGIWEVMKNQEAVNLIRHIDEPQEAAECLAKEALTRMSKSNISCLVIRFD